MKFRLASVLTLALFTTFTACKKDDKPVNDSSAEITAHSDDQSNVSDDLDAIANEVNLAVESNSSFSGKMEKTNSFCNADAVYDTLSNPRKITITYNGVDCFGARSRTGVVVLSMPSGVQWKDAGAALTVSFQNLKITRLLDNKSITINGEESFVNVTGGLLINLPTLQSITHTISSSNMTITFDDHSQRVWQVAKKRVFSLSGSSVVVTITGNHTEGNNTGIAVWGANRFGHAFTTSVTEPLVIRQDCNFRLTSGQVKHEGFATATATFGLDSNGVATSCPGVGHYYLKLEWTGPAGNSHSTILPY